MHNTWSYDDILALGSLRRPRNEQLKLCSNKDFDRYLGGQPSPQSTNYAKIIVVHCAFLSKNYEEILVLKSHNFMIGGMVVPQDTVRVLNSYVVVPQYWTMYDSLKIGGQTVPQLHIVYTKVNISKLSDGYLAKLKSSAPQSHHNFSSKTFSPWRWALFFFYASSITTMVSIISIQNHNENLLLLYIRKYEYYHYRSYYDIDANISRSRTMIDDYASSGRLHLWSQYDIQYPTAW